MNSILFEFNDFIPSTSKDILSIALRLLSLIIMTASLLDSKVALPASESAFNTELIISNLFQSLLFPQLS